MDLGTEVAYLEGTVVKPLYVAVCLISLICLPLLLSVEALGPDLAQNPRFEQIEDDGGSDGADVAARSSLQTDARRQSHGANDSPVRASHRTHDDHRLVSGAC